MSHQTISFIKSGIRIFGYAMLFPYAFGAAVLLILSELAGIVEEVGHE